MGQQHHFPHLYFASLACRRQLRQEGTSGPATWAGAAAQNELPLPPPKKKWKFLQVRMAWCLGGTCRLVWTVQATFMFRNFL